MTTSGVAYARISEIFGPTIQGEGPAAGQRATFVRLAGCPVGCDWCDTRYSWDPAARDPERLPGLISVDSVVADVLERSAPTDLVVLTGGEPLAQADAVAALVDRLRPHRPRLHLETAGMPTIPNGLLDRLELIVVSPKLRSAGPRARHHMQVGQYKRLAALDHSWFKFVVTSPADLREVERYETELGLTRIMIMAEGTDPAASIRATANMSADVINRGWSISPRLHVWMWGDEPGR